MHLNRVEISRTILQKIADDQTGKLGYRVFVVVEGIQFLTIEFTREEHQLVWRFFCTDTRHISRMTSLDLFYANLDGWVLDADDEPHPRKIILLARYKSVPDSNRDIRYKEGDSINFRYSINLDDI